MFKVSKERGRRLLKEPDYWKSYYLGTQWFFLLLLLLFPLFFPPSSRLAKLSVVKPAVLVWNGGTAMLQ